MEKINVYIDELDIMIGNDAPDSAVRLNTDRRWTFLYRRFMEYDTTSLELILIEARSLTYPGDARELTRVALKDFIWL